MLAVFAVGDRDVIWLETVNTRLKLLPGGNRWNDFEQLYLCTIYYMYYVYHVERHEHLWLQQMTFLSLRAYMQFILNFVLPSFYI